MPARMETRLDCPPALYRELFRWRARNGHSGDFHVCEADVALAEERMGLTIPRDLLVLELVRGETPATIADMTLAARAQGVPSDVIVFDQEPDILWCGLALENRAQVLGWHRTQARFLPASLSLVVFVQLDEDADGSDEPARIDPRHDFIVYWTSVLEVA